MDKESKYLLHLLRSFIRKEEPEVWSDVNWDKLMQIAYIHNLAGTLGYLTMTYPICPDTQKNSLLRQSCLNTIMGFANRGALAEAFGQMLAEKGIDHIWMKGFILRDFYPVPELRTYGDIDLVIRPKDRAKCHDFMLEQGFGVKTDWEPVYSYIKDNEFYEIHTELLEVDVSEKANCREYFRNLWEHAVSVENHQFRFEPEYHFLYLLAHLAKHVTGSGAGIRMYLDVAVFLQHYGNTLDWTMVEEELEKLSLRNFANVVFAFVEVYFGIRSPIEVKTIDPAVMDSFVKFTMDGGIFGKVGRDSGTVSLQEEFRNSGETTRAGTLINRLFPSAKSIQSRYTYLQDKPWLLPVAWLHRLIKTGNRLDVHTQEVRNILAADMEEVRKMTRLYKEIGL